MSNLRHREEVINTQLAILLSKLGVNADAETILARGRERPDVLLTLFGLRVVIEGKFEDHPNARTEVSNDAKGRVRNGIAHFAAAVVYPSSLRTVSTPKLEKRLEQAKLKYQIVSEAGQTDWFEGNPSDVMDALRRSQETLAKDDIVEKIARSLADRLEGIAQLWPDQPGVCDKLSELLGIYPPKGETNDQKEARRVTAAKVSALVIANALIFQEQLAITRKDVISLRKLEKEKSPVDFAIKHWRFIWEKINYIPVFQLGERVLTELPANRNTLGAFKGLLNETKNICEQQAALRHDLMGRVYHWLLHYAKYLGTYYTSVSAATLLLKLAMEKDWGMDFGDPRQLETFKVGDLACGTGTLLMASSQALADAHIKLRANTGRPLNPVDLQAFHRVIMESTLHGYDVLPSALHLTASTLALLAPEVAFVHMNLFIMPLGMIDHKPRLGSLDFLGRSMIVTQLSLDNTLVETIRAGVASTQEEKAFLPKLNLCVMNPPFVRSVGGNLLFGSLPGERGELQRELKRRTKKIGASATAGLGSVFVAMADEHLVEGGRLAFVLPAALASGEAWGETRKLIADRYHLETVVASHDALRHNFSENTDLSELLFIARKRKSKEKPAPAKYINLWRNPRSIHEALDLANRISNIVPADIDGKGIATIRSESGKLGEIITMPPASEQDNWTGALFAQTELLRTFWKLKQGTLIVPGVKTSLEIPLCKLGSLGELGYDRRDIHDAFVVSDEDWSPYKAFWDHKANKVLSIGQKPNANLLARSEAAKDRKLKDADKVWGKSGKILLVERVRTNTHRVLSVGFDTNVLGNTWWAFSSEKIELKHQKALLLWLNCTLSMLLFFAKRVVTEGAWMQMKKPAWASMPVLDVHSLPAKQINSLAKAYDNISKKDLEALCKLDVDPVREAIDGAISSALGLPDLKPLRELLSREPGLSGKEISPRETASQIPIFNEKGEEDETPSFSF